MTARRIFITGASGFVGSNLARRFVAAGHEVHVLVRSSTNRWRLHGLEASLKFHVADLSDLPRLGTITRLVQPDVVCHLGNAGIYGGESVVDRQLVETNLVGTMNLIEACRGVDYRCFVHAGSSSEYGPKREAMRETDLCAPTTTYGVSKCAATQYVLAVAQAETRPIAALRLFSPFGPYDDHRRLIVYAVACAMMGRPLSLAEPDAVRDFVYVEDVVDAVVACIERPVAASGRVFNVAGGRAISVGEVVRAVLRLTGSTSEIVWRAVPSRQWDTTTWQADITAARDALGWAPRHSFEQALSCFVAWFRQHGSMYQQWFSA